MTAPVAPRLAIGAAHLADLRSAAEAAYPNEFCALLIGMEETAESRVTRIVPAANVHPEPRIGFELDPKTLIKVLRELREAERPGRARGERLVGHAHSHPDGPARPSARDLSLAHEPGLFWLIMEVRDGRAGEMAVFLAAEHAAGAPELRPATLTI